MTGSHISLFSGVGMTDKAAEAAGFKTIATAEIDPFNRRVLERRFPDAKHFSDVKEVTCGGVVGPQAYRERLWLGATVQRPLLVTGGFPCQDVSNAGTGAGLDGERSGLYRELMRVVCEFRPDYVLIENVAALRGKGLDRVLNDLHHAGYDVQWDCIPAAWVGAPHLRDRIWIGAIKRGTRRNRHALEVESIGHVVRPGKGLRHGIEPITKLPRAGALIGGLLYRREPQATIAMAKKRFKGEPLPTPCAHDDNKSPEAHLAMKARLAGTPRRQITSLQVLAKAGFPEDRGRALSEELFPTAASAEAWRNGARPLFPTPTKQDGANNGGPAQMKRNSLPLNAFVKLYPTPRAAPNEWRTTKNAPSHGKTHGATLAGTINDEERAAGRVPAKPSDSAGNLAPRWVEWLMGLPQDWTNPDISNDALIEHNGWTAEPSPRTEANSPYRRQRLMALGNGLVWQVAAIALNDLLNW